MTTSNPRARWHRVALALCLAATVWFAVRGTAKQLRPGGSDFTIYYDAGRAVLGGADPMSDPEFIYLPVFAVLMTPFACLPYAIAAGVWEAVSLAAIWWAVYRCARLATPIGERVPSWLWWPPLACTLRLVDSNLGYGQVNAITFVLMLEGALALRHARETRAGLAFAAGAAIKLLPGFALVWTALRGAWRATFVGALAFVVIALGLPAIAMGPRASFAALDTWWTRTAQPYQRGGDELLEVREYLPGQSLIASGYRILCATPATSRGESGPRANLFELEPDTAHIILRIAVALHLIAFLATAWKRRATPSSRHFAVETALVLTTVLLVAPLVHKAHMLWLMLAYAALFSVWSEERSRAARIVRNTLVVVSIALIAFTTPAIAGSSVAQGLLSHNAIFFGAEALFAALLIERWCAARAEI